MIFESKKKQAYFINYYFQCELIVFCLMLLNPIFNPKHLVHTVPSVKGTIATK